jgi:hypothetical protein
MKNTLLLLLLLPATLIAQYTKQANWQQQVNYKIDVELDAPARILRGNIVIEYINNSPVALDSIYMHLWPNAYSSTQTAFAKQLLQNRNTSFLYADESDRGYIDSLSFSVNQSAATWSLTSHVDIAAIKLNQPLASGQRIFITTPFKVKLPAIFSRSGYENGIFCITQWYPKPAVFDVNGWNPMPYLELGEFYSEFGNYEVNITVPTEMVVAATGNLQNEEELAWWQDLSKKHPNTNPKKSLRFIQNNVHDFAWFASRKFLISEGHVDLPSGRQVKTRLFYANPDTLKRREGVNYINNAIRYYSHYVGEYPYDHATVVITPLRAGGGMEYPTITNCTSVNEQVIAHEVGHNWFYGILGSNERNHPWMDESLNTYYENRMRHESGSLPKYNRFLRYLRTEDKVAGFTDLFTPFEFTEFQYHLSAKQNNDQCGHLHAAEYTDANYGDIIYAKNPKLFYYLQCYLGDTVFDNMMRTYYQKWKFRHPLPDDFKQHVNEYTGKNLDWFWNELFNTTRKQHIQLAGVKQVNGNYELTVNSNMSAPFPVSTIKNDTVITTQWYKPGDKIALNAANADAIRVDAHGATLDFCREDNTYRIGKLFPKLNPVAFRPIADLYSPYETRINYLPIMGANMYNKTMLGIALYNTNVPRQPFEYMLAPLYSFGTRDLAGYANMQYTRLLPQQKLFDKITFGINWQRFAFNGSYTVPDIDFAGNPYDRSVFGSKVYEKIDPYIQLRIGKDDKRSPVDRWVRLNYNMVNEQQHTQGLFSNFGNHHAFFNARFQQVNSRALEPYRFAVNYEWGNTNSSFQKLSANGQYTFTYNKPGKGLTMRGAGGVFLQKPGNTSFGQEYWRIGNNTGLFDYQFNQALLGRSEVNGLFAHQLLVGDAQFHVINYSLYTDSWFTSTNLQTTLPGVIPVRLYADIAAINNRTLLTTATASGQTTTIQYNTELLYTGGICVYLFGGIFQVHVPMFASQQITEFWYQNNIKFQERINFTLHLDELNLYRIIQGLKM